ncbi:hypothetical protein A2U01_0089371, partial [Trifolium medium]|nr:hypothetical protein [Trifolium medium]
TIVVASVTASIHSEPEFQLASEQTPCSVWVSSREGVFWHYGQGRRICEQTTSSR